MIGKYGGYPSLANPSIILGAWLRYANEDIAIIAQISTVAIQYPISLAVMV
jgi:hypothetical protein